MASAASHAAAGAPPTGVAPPPPPPPPEAGDYSGSSPLANSWATKRKRPSEVSQQKQPMVTRSPVVTWSLASPVVMGERGSPTLPAATPGAGEGSMSPAMSPSQYAEEGTGAAYPSSRDRAPRKQRKLISTIWKDMDPIYEGAILVKGRCKHCHEVFSAARNSGTSHLRRHLSVCEARLNRHELVEKLQSSVLPIESIYPTMPQSRPIEERTGVAHPTSHGQAQRKLRKLRSTIWKDMDPVYEGGTLAKGRCKHCHEVFSAARNSGTSNMLRHLSVCELRLNTHEMVDELQSSVLPTEFISPATLPSPPVEEETGATHPISHDQTPSKLRKLRSTIWKDMDPVYECGTLAKGRCKHCHEVFPAARNSGTSHMRRHLSACEPRLKMHEMVKKLQSSVLPTESVVGTNWKFDRYITRCELVRMIVLYKLPFSFVEYDGFRSYSASLNPLAERVSRTAMKENCIEAYKNQRSILRETFGGSSCRFSLTADLWRSKQNKEYICITCHYIDNEWKVQKKIIRFCVLKTPHDASNICSVILRTIQIYNIEDKLFSITLDNASVNKSMIDLLQPNLLTRGMLHCDGDFFHVRCAVQILNLIGKDGLQEIDGVVEKIRESVKFIGSSTSMEKFEDIIEEMGIYCGSYPSLDVATRWNSTCDMLESALPFKDVFHALGQQDPNYIHCPSPEEWQRVAVVCNLLKVFKKAIEVLSSSKYPTSNLYFHEIWSVRQVLEDEKSNINTTVAAMVSEMENKFQEYWKISYLTNCIPVILDPRFKFGFIEFRLTQAYGKHAGVHIAKVDKAIRNLFVGYSSQMRDTFNSSTQENGTAAAAKSHSWSDWSRHVSGRNNQVSQMGDTFNTSTQENGTAAAAKSHSWSDWRQHVSGRNNQVTYELDKYLQDDLFPSDDDKFDILQWWKMNAAKYPIVARMARDVLVVPASTVASESAFSTSGRIINDHRTRLAGNTLEALICFQDWLRASGSSYLDIISITKPESNIEDFH